MVNPDFCEVAYRILICSAIFDALLIHRGSKCEYHNTPVATYVFCLTFQRLELTNLTNLDSHRRKSTVVMLVLSVFLPEYTGWLVLISSRAHSLLIQLI